MKTSRVVSQSYSELQSSRLTKLGTLSHANIPGSMSTEYSLLCFCRLIIILPVKVCLPCLSLIKVTNMVEIPHQIQKSFSPVPSINSSQTGIALPVKTSKPNFVTFFVYFGNSAFDYCEISLLQQTEKPFWS